MVFKDRADAAKELAEMLEHLKNGDLIILAIPRGGVVTGDLIGKALGAKLDAVVPRKLGAPYNPELAIGAVMHDGSYFLNREIVETMRVSKAYIDEEIAAQTREIERRLMAFRGSKSYDSLEGKTVVLVDDGIATGATMFATAQWVRKQKPGKLVIAVPVGPPDTIERLKKIADEVAVILTPPLFQAVGEFYEDFAQVTDDEVREIMKKRGAEI